MEAGEQVSDVIRRGKTSGQTFNSSLYRDQSPSASPWSLHSPLPPPSGYKWTDNFQWTLIPNLKSLKIKTNLLAITGEECMTSTRAFVWIKMLTSYLQSLQLNVNKFSTCTYKLQISYIITQVTKLYPITHTVTQFYSPSLLLWSQQSTIRVTTITNRHKETWKNRDHEGFLDETKRWDA